MSTHYRWLIEHYASTPAEPLYLAMRPGHVECTRWTHKWADAMQFRTKEDAENYATTFLIGPMRVAEHGFDGRE